MPQCNLGFSIAVRPVAQGTAVTEPGGDYAFPHAQAEERRRLDLFAERLDPLTMRRVERLRISRDASCLEVGGGRSSVARWLCELVGEEGHGHSY